MANEHRFCIFCSQEVKTITKSDKEKTWGKGTQAGEFIHVKTSDKGISYCGRHFLTEEQTYTEGDRDPNEPA